MSLACPGRAFRRRRAVLGLPSLLPFCFFLAEDFGGGFLDVGGVFHGGALHAEAAESAGFAGDAGDRGADAVLVGDEGGGIVGTDAEGGGGGNGILVGPEEEKFPMVDVFLVNDALVDVGHGEAGGGVFESVGEDGDNDLAGPVGFGGGGQAFAEGVDGGADGIEQGGAAPGGVGGGVEAGDLGNGESVHRGFDAVIEEHEGEAGLARQGLLVAQELIEPGNGLLDQRRHGAGSVEDEGDFGEVGVHDFRTF